MFCVDWCCRVSVRYDRLCSVSTHADKHLYQCGLFSLKCLWMCLKRSCMRTVRITAVYCYSVRSSHCTVTLFTFRAAQCLDRETFNWGQFISQAVFLLNELLYNSCWHRLWAGCQPVKQHNGVMLIHTGCVTVCVKSAKM